MKHIIVDFRRVVRLNVDIWSQDLHNSGFPVNTPISQSYYHILSHPYRNLVQDIVLTIPHKSKILGAIKFRVNVISPKFLHSIYFQSVATKLTHSLGQIWQVLTISGFISSAILERTKSTTSSLDKTSQIPEERTKMANLTVNYSSVSNTCLCNNCNFSKGELLNASQTGTVHSFL